jgi:DNA-binding response OmpR family regulator
LKYLKDRRWQPMTHVLIVEDQRLVAELYAEMLKPHYTVTIAYSAEEAMKKLNQNIDIVLLDRMMPGMSGDELLKKIRSTPEISNLYVILVTAVKPDVEILCMGFNDYLTKPVKSKELLDAIERGIIRRAYDECINEYFDIIYKLNAVSQSVEESILTKHPEYLRLKKRAEKLKKEIDILRDGLIELTEQHNKILTV